MVKVIPLNKTKIVKKKVNRFFRYHSDRWDRLKVFLIFIIY